MGTAPKLRLVFHVKHFTTLLLLAFVLSWSAGCTMSRSPITGKKRAYA